MAESHLRNCELSRDPVFGDFERFFGGCRLARELQTDRAIMDVARPDIARKKKQTRLLLLFVSAAGIVAVTFFLARLEPALPKVDSAAIWTDDVKRGEMLRQVRGNGTLVPEEIQFVQSETAGTIEKIHVLPGAVVEPDTVILELSNKDLEQDIFDREWAIKQSEALQVQLEVRLESERLNKKIAVEKLKADYEYAALEAAAYQKLETDGLVAALESRRYRLRAEDFGARYTNEIAGISMDKRSADAQLAVKDADLLKLRAALVMKKEQLTNLTVRAGIAGVLQEIGDGRKLEIGQRLGPNVTLAKIVIPDNLKAEIKIAETQVKDVRIGLRAEIDTRNGIIPGTVVRVDPAVDNGTVTVDVRLDGELPPGARPDLSVDGTIEIERLENVLHVGRPVRAVPDTEAKIFKLIENGTIGLLVPVKWGRSSVSVIEIAEGLDVGDKLILSDVSEFGDYEKVRIE
jgi:HlyD family secretion protein